MRTELEAAGLSILLLLGYIIFLVATQPDPTVVAARTYQFTPGCQGLAPDMQTARCEDAR